MKKKTIKSNNFVNLGKLTKFKKIIEEIVLILPFVTLAKFVITHCLVRLFCKLLSKNIYIVLSVLTFLNLASGTWYKYNNNNNNNKKD